MKSLLVSFLNKKYYTANMKVIILMFFLIPPLMQCKAAYEDYVNTLHIENDSEAGTLFIDGVESKSVKLNPYPEKCELKVSANEAHGYSFYRFKSWKEEIFYVGNDKQYVSNPTVFDFRTQDAKDDLNHISVKYDRFDILLTVPCFDVEDGLYSLVSPSLRNSSAGETKIITVSENGTYTLISDFDASGYNLITNLYGIILSNGTSLFLMNKDTGIMEKIFEKLDVKTGLNMTSNSSKILVRSNAENGDEVIYSVYDFKRKIFTEIPCGNLKRSDCVYYDKKTLSWFADSDLNLYVDDNGTWIKSVSLMNGTGGDVTGTVKRCSESNVIIFSSGLRNRIHPNTEPIKFSYWLYRPGSGLSAQKIDFPDNFSYTDFSWNKEYSALYYSDYNNSSGKYDFHKLLMPQTAGANTVDSVIFSKRHNSYPVACSDKYLYFINYHSDFREIYRFTFEDQSITRITPPLYELWK